VASPETRGGDDLHEKMGKAYEEIVTNIKSLKFLGEYWEGEEAPLKKRVLPSPNVRKMLPRSVNSLWHQSLTIP
jgi:hypothetical protein